MEVHGWQLSSSRTLKFLHFHSLPVLQKWWIIKHRIQCTLCNQYLEFLCIYLNRYKLHQCMSTFNNQLIFVFYVRTTCNFQFRYKNSLVLVYVETDQWLQSSLQQQRNLALDLIPAYRYTENIQMQLVKKK